MPGLADTPGVSPPGLGFSVFSQKVELDIDFATRSVVGKTEITIQPHHRELKTISLHCRQCVLTRISVEGKGPPTRYQEPYSRLKLHSGATAHQHHLLRQKIGPQGKNPEGRDPPPEELLITLPRSVKIEEVDPFSNAAQDELLAKAGGNIKSEAGDVTSLVETPIARTAEDHGSRFTPLKIKIEYTISHFRDGLHFVGLQEGDPRFPHCYTRNSPYGKNACCLFPCVDDDSTKCIWEISIRCPRTLGDAFKTRQLSHVNGVHESSGTNGIALNGAHSGMTNGNSASDSLAQDDEIGPSDKSLDMVVVSSGEVTDEIIDPVEPSRKTVSFFCATPVAARHIGFAVGPFEHVDLAQYRGIDEDEKLGQNAIPVDGYCLPGRLQELRDTCEPVAKAVDFFTTTFGTYPYANYKLCFVDDLVEDVADTASLSICSNRLLYPRTVLDPLYSATRTLVHAIASQWIGVNIVADKPSDMWAVVGISYFITDLFLKKLCGNNEYRFQQKLACDRVFNLDVLRPPILTLGTTLHLHPSEAEFLALKSPLVLFILDRRLTKSSGSSGLPRIISRLFLTARTGEMLNGALTTASVQRTCEKLGHSNLESFFKQWVYGAGCPSFLVTTRFNKKKLVIEMVIDQVQKDRKTDHAMTPDTFEQEVQEDLQQVYAGETPPFFTGPMTIRIHEADGTPYEHIVEIKEQKISFEIPYNTKYKRLKRTRRQKERLAAKAGQDIAIAMDNADDDVLLYCLGDVLQTEDEIAEWRLADWSKEHEDEMNQQSYEWIRMDADFEWIAKIEIQQPPYMVVSQLQQDRDVVAQLESIQYIEKHAGPPISSTVLVRTLVDRRYFHGIRTAAAMALAKCAKEETDWLGLFHLEKVFQEFYCFPDSPMTRSNDFSDRTSYLVQCAIPAAIAKIKDGSGRTPIRVKRFFIDKLKFNDNSNNEYSDDHYVATLVKGLTETLIGREGGMSFTFGAEDDEDDEAAFQKEALDDIDRFRRIDEYVPSYHNVHTTTALECLTRLALAKVINTRIDDFLPYTRIGNADTVRLKAFRCLSQLDLLRNPALMKWLLFNVETEPSPSVREHLLHIFWTALASIAIAPTRPKALHPHKIGALVIEQEEVVEDRQADFERTHSVSAALAALKVELENEVTLMRGLWNAVRSPIIGLKEMLDLLDICAILYDPITSMMVTLKYPHYWRVKHMGRGLLKFTPSPNIRTSPSPVFVTPRSNPHQQLPPPLSIPTNYDTLPVQIAEHHHKQAQPKLSRKHSMANAMATSNGSPQAHEPSGKIKRIKLKTRPSIATSTSLSQSRPLPTHDADAPATSPPTRSAAPDRSQHFFTAEREVLSPGSIMSPPPPPVLSPSTNTTDNPRTLPPPAKKPRIKIRLGSQAGLAGGAGGGGMSPPAG